MQPSSAVHSLSFSKTLRPGQQAILAKALEQGRGVLSCRLPTGYGKTLAAVATYAGLKAAGKVNRLLYLVPTTAQQDQFEKDAPIDFHSAGLPGTHVFVIGERPTVAIKSHKQNKSEIFITTIQALASGRNVPEAIAEMMATGSWMVVVDEYHHYGEGKVWGATVMGLPSVFTLAMSATPRRSGQDDAFPEPSVTVTYTEAEEAKAVKRLTLHRYNYKVDTIDANGEILSVTTDEMALAAGSCAPDAIDDYIVQRKMRWSPKYVSPLVSSPIERLLSKRLATGLPLQAIINCMGCKHAEMVFEQVRSVFGDMLRIDWVGTGPYGRSDDVNRAAIKKFCPPKRSATAARDPRDVEIDILVNVGLAGEGLDSVYVSEVIFLCPASLANQTLQKAGRAARRVPGGESANIATINVDTATPLAEYSGSAIMRAFDLDAPEAPDRGRDGDEDGGGCDPQPLPLDPAVGVLDCALINIDKGDPEVKAWAECLIAAGKGMEGCPVFDDEMAKEESALIARAIQLRRDELAERSKGGDRMAVLAQLSLAVEQAVGKCVGVTIRAIHGAQGRFERSLAGDIKKRINQAKARACGPKADGDEDALRKHYRWCVDLETGIRSKGVPSWLS